MPYHGVLSRGCQSCRRRKVKACEAANCPQVRALLTLLLRTQCDERKPGCLRCEKSRISCPGYRDLNELLFRDESERVARRMLQGPQATSAPAQLVLAPADSELPRVPRISPELSPPPPVAELGANFFFAKYSYGESPHYSNYQQWLGVSYHSSGPTVGLRAAIEAVGLAGIANMSPSKHLAASSKQRYCQAVREVQLALKDPVHAISDTTLMTVFLLGLFEVRPVKLVQSSLALSL